MMHKMSLVCYLVCLSCLTASSVAAGDPAGSFDQCVEEAKSAGADGQLVLNCWKKAVEEAEKSSGNSTELAFALVHLGDSYAGKNNDLSVATYKRGLDVREKAGSTETLGMMRNLLRYAMMKQSGEVTNIRKLEKMKPADSTPVQTLLERALEIAKKCSAPEALQFQIMQCLSSEYYNNKNNDQAETLSLKMLELAEKPNNAHSREEQIAGYGNLLLIYSDTNRINEYKLVREKLSAAADATPNADQIKDSQDSYGAAEKIVDESEEQAFRSKNGFPSN